MIVALAVRLWRFAAGWFCALSHICRAPRTIAQADGMWNEKCVMGNYFCLAVLVMEDRILTSSRQSSIMLS